MGDDDGRAKLFRSVRLGKIKEVIVSLLFAQEINRLKQQCYSSVTPIIGK